MLDNKLKKLEEIIKGYGQMLVALSGGVDSSFLLAFACKVFDEEGRPDAVAALTASGPQFAGDEQAYAEKLCDRLGIAHKKVDVGHVVGMIKRNPIDRCYHCKREMFGILKERADMVGSVLCDGTNADDMADYRPGNRAIEELGIASPLKEAGLTKDEIRQALAGLDVGGVKEMAEKPAFACLATRIPYGETITEQKMKAIDEAENFLKSEGFSQVRVRCHEIAGKVSGNDTRFMARIECLPGEMGRMMEMAKGTEEKLQSLGFEFVTLDLGGYEKGKMNSMIEGMEEPDRIKVSETVVRGNAANVETADVMAEIDRFLKETREQDYSFSDFVDIIEKLRQPDGCPWDREQTHESLKKHMVEEANEALDAIDEKDWDHLCEELGDVLLQIVLHSQIAAEAGEFTIDDVVQCVSEKMIRRHPHVFGNIDVSSVDEGLDLWEEIKKREKTATK
ncbi:MAG: ATP-dependent sacrificial sulfur transferase LarE [Clostridia bacterium]|nr:ATP-dependent sacrificial sulfur transferase LarE [Clostridia bacterium]